MFFFFFHKKLLCLKTPFTLASGGSQIFSAFHCRPWNVNGRSFINCIISFSCHKESHFVDLPSTEMKDCMFLQDTAYWNGAPLNQHSIKDQLGKRKSGYFNVIRNSESKNIINHCRKIYIFFDWEHYAKDMQSFQIPCGQRVSAPFVLIPEDKTYPSCRLGESKLENHALSTHIPIDPQLTQPPKLRFLVVWFFVVVVFGFIWWWWFFYTEVLLSLCWDYIAPQQRWHFCASYWKST